MNADQTVNKLAELRCEYEQDCATLHLALYGKPWLLNPRLQERGDKYDADVRAVLAQAQRGVTKLMIEYEIDKP